MPTRTIQFWGHTQGEAQAMCQINGQTVFDGILAADQQNRVLWNAQIPIDWHGSLPVQIHCSSGMLYHDGVMANYNGLQRDLTGISEQWQSAHPQYDVATVVADLKSKLEVELINWYGNDLPMPGDLIWTTTLPSDENYWFASGEMTADSDGKNNVRVNGGPARETLDPVQRRNDPVMMGHWGYRIWAGETLTYDLILTAPVDVD